jgi:hypothetical protein
MKEKSAEEITVTESVNLTGYSRQHIYNLVFQRRVVARKRGWEYWIDRDSLLDYLRGPLARKPRVSTP